MMHFSFPFASLLLSAFALSCFCVFSVSCAKPPFGTVVKNLRFYDGSGGVSPQRLIVPPYPPHSRLRGGASRPSHRTSAHILAHAAKRPRLPADYSRPLRRQFR